VCALVRVSVCVVVCVRAWWGERESVCARVCVCVCVCASAILHAGAFGSLLFA